MVFDYYNESTPLSGGLYMSKKECPFCNSEHTQKDGRQKDMQRYRCMNCRKRFLSGIYEGVFSYITHFNTKLKQTDHNVLTRDNYCTPSRDVDYGIKKMLQEGKVFFERNGRYPLLYPSYLCKIPNDIFADYEHYTEEYVSKHYADCMTNFDLNMAYFEKLDSNQFNRYLSLFVKKNKFREITDLQEVAGASGIYILVLDKYKQVYIGKSQSANGMKSRILSHWSRKKEFGRLIYGRVDTSILPIDVFGALDTTRIFVREYRGSQDLDVAEQHLVEKFDAKYRLNRVAGGLNAEADSPLRNIQLLSSMQNRNLKQNSDEPQ